MSLPKALSPERIQQLLAWLQAGRPPQDATLVHDYGRLMEVYCVVKTGGVRIQRQASQDFLQRQQARIEQEIADDPEATGVAALHQEIQDLHDSVGWRVAFLKSISPEEEVAVAAIASLIEAQHQG